MGFFVKLITTLLSQKIGICYSHGRCCLPIDF